VKMICVLQSDMDSNSDLKDMITETLRRVCLAMTLVSYFEARFILPFTGALYVLSDNTYHSFTQTLMCYVKQCNARCYSKLL
jgi:hypothetical protein